MLTIYDRIEFLIKNKPMTKKLFCTELSISTGNLGDWKRGKSTPSTHKLIEISIYFNVSLDWLILGKETQIELMKEAQAEYILNTSLLHKLALSKLSAQEERFIREYIQFTDYRRNIKSK
ncbi:helix-turn-helix domain-containing protein [Paenibacillus sp. CMAA1364]